VETDFAGSFRPSSVRCVAWVVRSCPREGLCRSQMMMALEIPFPLRMLSAWSPGWLLTRWRIGILNFSPPDFCGDETTAEKFPPGGGCVCPVSNSTMPALGCSCPAPRGGSRAARVLSEELSLALCVWPCVCCINVGAFTCCRAPSAGFFFCGFPISWLNCCWPIPILAGMFISTLLRRSLGLAFVVGCVNCSMSWQIVAWGIDSHHSCRLLLPACSHPSSRGRSGAFRAKRFSQIEAFSPWSCDSCRASGACARPCSIA